MDGAFIHGVSNNKARNEIRREQLICKAIVIGRVDSAARRRFSKSFRVYMYETLDMLSALKHDFSMQHFPLRYRGDRYTEQVLKIRSPIMTEDE